MKLSSLCALNLLLLISLAQAEEFPDNHSLVELLPEQYRSSPYYRILDVHLQDDLYLFDVETEVGIHSIQSVALLIKRLQEIELLSQAKYQFNEDESSEVIPGQIRIQSDSAVDLITSPITSAGSLVGQFANNFGDTLSGEVHYSASGSLYASSENADPNFSMHRRNIANQLSLDVYSLNRYLQTYLNAMARARSAGDISAGTKQVNFNRSYKHYPDNGRIEREAEQILRRYELEDLKQYQQLQLKSMRVSDELAEQFLNHEHLTPSIQIRIMQHMDYLYQVKNSESVIAAALSVNSNAEAHNFLHNLRLLLSSYEKEKFTALTAIDKHLIATAKGKKTRIFFASDILYENPVQLESLAKITTSARNRKFGEVLITQGIISNAIKQRLLNQEIDFFEQALAY